MNKKLIDWWIGGASYDSDYQAVLDRATTLGYTLPTNAQKTTQNQLVKDLKSNGLWTLLDLFYSPANNGSENFGKLNWKSPSSYALTTSGTPSWSSNVGYSVVTGSYLNTNYKPRTNGVNVTLNNASFGGKFVVTRATNYCFGCATGGPPPALTDDGLILQIATGSNNFVKVFIDGGSSTTVTSSATDLYCHVRRPDASNQYGQVSSTEATSAFSSSALPDQNLLLLNRGDGAGTQDNATCKVFFAGANGAAGATMKSLLDAYILAL